ncbi:MAG: family 43 glycosylhydrolase [Flavisolibacter sp.]|nr:family 43 glycosylhydrolase [Flavisolibacter sp.]MBD0295129.1 family 43 glycosylhydrolase [Flavisolibacter sp.]MBD0349822.1 family 43 glycosylhydrolase [Flavisolibacter sp.]MBD0368952.1 family 43 glycosylhydrolase [Flavisolibacter sp.]
MKRKIAASFFLLAFVLSCATSHKAVKKNDDFITNPIVNGYYADPCIVKDGDTYYIYATIDPWGGEELAVLETKDFKHFTQRHLNWPTKKACTSPTSKGSMVWAPSVRKAADGKYYMYVSVGSEVWAGVSDAPLGPWKNAKADNSPLVAYNNFPQVHNIDADCFIDDDGQAYLYWGSGFNWVNGHCMAAKLNKDMASFDGTPKEVTPPYYFEGPHMIKRFGKYYLMFSEGKAIDATYQVGYSIGNTPFGPFTEGVNRPILFTSPDSSTYGPGHHTVFREKGQDYILYHRIFPQKEKFVLRQLCMDSLNYDENGNMKKIVPKGVYNFTKKK